MLFQELRYWCLPWRLSQSIENDEITKNTLTLAVFVLNPEEALDLLKILPYKLGHCFVYSVPCKLKFERDGLAFEFILLAW